MVAAPDQREPHPPRAVQDAPKPGNTLRSGLGLAHHPVVLLLGLMLVVGALTAAVHWPALSAQALSLDDQQFLTDNRLVRNPSWASASRFFAEVLQPSTVRGYYLPLSMISLMLDYAMGGRPDDLRAFHRTSLALHVLNTVLIVALLYSLFGHPVPAALVGLLFGVHPLTVEPVAWVGERKTLLAAFFTLGCLLAYVRYARRGSPRWFAAALLAYVFGLLSKPTAGPLPLVLLILDYWPLRRLALRTVVEKGPFLAVGVVFAVVTFVSHSRTAGILAPSAAAPWQLPLVICHLLVFYLGKIVWPTNLTSVYPLPEPLSPTNPVILAGLLGTGVLVAVLLFSLRRTRAPLTGGLLFFVAILPTLGVIQYSWVTASDKYVYVPALGVLMILAWGLSRMWNTGASSRMLPKLGLVVLVLCLFLAEGRATRRYLVSWRNTLSLAQHMVQLAPEAPGAHNHLGNALGAQGRLDEAIAHFRRALQLLPGYPEASYNLGVALRLRGWLDEAVDYLTYAVQTNPNDAHTHYHLGLALQGQGRLGEAIAQFQHALRLDPDDALAHYSLGQTLQTQGQFDEAIDHFDQALRLNPHYVDAHSNLGALLVGRGRLEEALRHFRLALEIAPDHTDALCNLGSVLASQGKLDEAIRHLRRALSVQPEHAEAHYNLGLALQRQGKLEEAISHYHQALQSKPDYAEAYHGLGVALTLAGEFEEATIHFREAVRLKPEWLPPLNALAWILATHPDPDVRREDEAVRLAERACTLTRYQDAGVLDTLAAAYAAAGRFDRAVTTAEKALALASLGGADGLARTIGGRLELYRQGEPYREPATTAGDVRP